MTSLCLDSWTNDDENRVAERHIMSNPKVLLALTKESFLFQMSTYSNKIVFLSTISLIILYLNYLYIFSSYWYILSTPLLSKVALNFQIYPFYYTEYIVFSNLGVHVISSNIVVVMSKLITSYVNFRTLSTGASGSFKRNMLYFITLELIIYCLLEKCDWLVSDQQHMLAFW